MTKLRILWTLILSILVCSSCQEELFPGFKKVEPGLPAFISLDVDVPAAHTVATKGIYEYENRIENLALVFYERTTPPYRQMIVNLTEADFIRTTPTDNNNDGRADYVSYSLNKEIANDASGQPILSGTYAVYAIANYNSPFCNLGSNIEEFKQKIAGLDETAFKALMAQNTNQYQFIGKSTMPMTGVAQNTNNTNNGSDNDIINIYPVGETSTGSSNSLNISLKRALAHIEVRFENDPTSAMQPAFVPMKYSILRLPRTANLFSKGINPGDNNIGTPAKDVSTAFTPEESKFLQDNYFSVISQEFVGATNSFEFFMMENSHANVEAVTAYTQREDWTNYDKNHLTADVDKKFKYAPDCATYVVVEGIYNGKDYSGTTSYTIHLGNFTNSVGASIGNFNVNRNEYHTYKVMIKSASSVVTESTIEGVATGQAPGAEGTLVKHTQNASRFVLDSHYETVKIVFHKKSAAELAQSNDEIVLLVSTPKTLYNAETYGEYSMKLVNGEIVVTDIYHGTKNHVLTPEELALLDIHWVRFMKPNNDGSFPLYKPEGKGSVGIVDFVKEIFSAEPTNPATQKHCIAKEVSVTDPETNITKTSVEITTTCFVDEYFYDDLTWPEFVNKQNRIIAVVSSKEALNDGNSFEYMNYMFHISQRSIKTVYADNPDINAFGLETWNETGLVRYGVTSKQLSAAGVSSANGYNNAWNMVDKNLFGDVALMSKVGHKENIEDNKKDQHWFTKSNNTEFDPKINAFNACMTRNRDENGNGQIDKDELKWYLPTHTQYLTLWLGNDVLSSETRLLSNEGAEKLNLKLNELVSSGMNDEADDLYSTLIYHTSSDFSNSKVWIYEGAAFGGETSSTQKYALRCVRNLKDITSEDAVNGKPVYGDQVEPVSSFDPASRKMTVDKIRMYRENIIEGPYRFEHQEKDIDNLPPKVFEVDASDLVNNHADKNMNKNRFWLHVPEGTLSHENYIELIRDNTDVCGRLRGKGWRIPNQREMLLMYLHTPLPNIKNFSSWPHDWGTEYPNNITESDLPLPVHAKEGESNYYATSTYGNPYVRASRPYNLVMSMTQPGTFDQSKPTLSVKINLGTYNKGYYIRCVRDAQ